MNIQLLTFFFLPKLSYIHYKWLFLDVRKWLIERFDNNVICISGISNCKMIKLHDRRTIFPGVDLLNFKIENTSVCYCYCCCCCPGLWWNKLVIWLRLFKPRQKFTELRPPQSWQSKTSCLIKSCCINLRLAKCYGVRANESLIKIKRSWLVRTIWIMP